MGVRFRVQINEGGLGRLYFLANNRDKWQSRPVRTRWSMGGVACAVLWVVNGIQKRTVTMIVYK